MNWKKNQFNVVEWISKNNLAKRCNTRLKWVTDEAVDVVGVAGDADEEEADAGQQSRRETVVETGAGLANAHVQPVPGPQLRVQRHRRTYLSVRPPFDLYTQPNS